MKWDVIDFIHELQYEHIPSDIIAVMERSLLDTIGVAAIGSSTQIASIMRQFVPMHMPASDTSPRARMLFTGQTVSPMGAAMAGAFMIDSIDAHDGNSFLKGHAGSGVFPAIMAVLDDEVRQGKLVSGKELLVLLTIAYEVGYRSGLCMHATVDDYHTSGTWTAVGAAAALSRLLQLDKQQTRHALGIAEYHGPRSQMMRCIDHPTMLRDGVGWGAPTAVSSVYMAQQGFTGAPAITAEGEQAHPYWQDLGERWEISNTHYKAYPVCRWAHPAIDLVQAMMLENQLTSSDIVAAKIRTFHNATRLAGHAPQTMDELTYALAYPFAIMLVHGEIGPQQLQESILHDPEVQRISLATEIIDDEHYTKISVGKRWADVSLMLKDGRQLTSPPATPRGDPDNPLSDEEMRRKYHLLADDIIGVERASVIEQMVARVAEDDFDLAQLLELLYPR